MRRTDEGNDEHMRKLNAAQKGRQSCNGWLQLRPIIRWHLYLQKVVFSGHPASAWAPQGSSPPGVYCTVLPPFQKGVQMKHQLLASLQP